jgi:glycosyltransferase involved in cell wall biosynthesis
MRILICTHAPLDPRFGAAQIALNLAEGLRGHGHEVELWSPDLLPPVQTRFWRQLPRLRAGLNAFLRSNGSWDIIDAPPALLTRLATRKSRGVARDVQPDLHYIYTNRFFPRRPRQFLTYPFHIWDSLQGVLCCIAGMRRARRVLVLGSRNLEVTLRLLPFLKHKARSYRCALQAEERAHLKQIRDARDKSAPQALNFIWIGRWTPTKDPERLLRIIETWRDHNVHFTIAGCGKAGAEIVNQRCDHRKVSVIPEYAREQLPGILAKHSAGIFTSKVEGWGLCLNEMIEAGMPVFVTEAGAVQDLRLVVGGMIQPIFALEKPFTTLPESNLDWARYDKLFSWDKISEQYLADVAGA